MAFWQGYNNAGGPAAMPLRDHFRPPLDDLTSWEGLYGGWPAVFVQQLNKTLPPSYAAAPRVHSGSYVEIDVADYETEEADSPDADAYEVRVFDTERGRRLVAAVEIV